MNTRTYILFLLTALFTLSCSERVSYLDAEFPGLTPEIYAEGIINVEGRFQQNLTMSPDGREHYFTQTDSELWRYERILRVRQEGAEVRTDTPQFVTDFEYANQWFIGEPMIAPDGQSLYFVADYPPDLWRSSRTEQGDWASPQKLDRLSTEKDDWYPTFSATNTMYFTNGTVFEVESGSDTRIPVEIPFSQKDIRDPCISPNEDYLIFVAKDSAGYGEGDLYISFKNDSGHWSHAQNLGPAINTKHLEFAPYISPDGRFLFFSRRDQWQQARFSNIYWVSLDVIEPFRN